MIENVVIRVSCLIDDLTACVKENGKEFDLIAKAWQLDMREIQNDSESMPIVYHLDNKEDIKLVLDNGATIFDLSDIVGKYELHEDTMSKFFNYNSIFRCTLYTKEELHTCILLAINSIAEKVMLYPYKEVYSELYKKFVVPMIEQQMQ